MDETRAYKTKRDDIEWVGGKRVDADGKVNLTEAQAAPELARDLIELCADDKPGKKAKPAPGEGEG